MSTFLQVSGAIFWLSLGAGGLWVGLCYAVHWWQARRALAKRVDRARRIKANADEITARMLSEFERYVSGRRTYP